LRNENSANDDRMGIPKYVRSSTWGRKSPRKIKVTIWRSFQSSEVSRFLKRAILHYRCPLTINVKKQASFKGDYIIYDDSWRHLKHVDMLRNDAVTMLIFLQRFFINDIKVWSKASNKMNFWNPESFYAIEATRNQRWSHICTM